MNYFVLFSLLNFTEYPPIRDNVTQKHGTIVADIESHLPAGHPYQDQDMITLVHEGTHGVNSALRNKYGVPAFYMLDNKAVLLDKELNIRLSDVARSIPASLRGEVYKLYLVDMQRYWNDQPSYIFDEFVAYTNGAKCRNLLKIKDRKETVRYMLEFCVYSICACKEAKENDDQTLGFVKWQIERAVQIYDDSDVKSDYLDNLTNEDAKELLEYIRYNFGKEWTRKMLGV